MAAPGVAGSSWHTSDSAERDLMAYRDKHHAPAARSAIVNFLDTELRTAQIKDYSCNGLQVEGAVSVCKIALAVDACIEAYREAVRLDCQMLIVHHGIIWEGIRSVRGTILHHIRFLLENDLNLYASHLPLDCHPTLGNNARLVSILGLHKRKPFGMYHGMEIGFEGVLQRPAGMKALGARLGAALGGPVSMLEFGPKKIRSVAIVSGGAAGELPEAIDKQIDCYVTGESSHENYHAAREAGINVIYCGHYHSEKAGVLAVGELLEKKFGCSTCFIDLPTPI
jgi:dinuclear metal center YbgI/SA1388 family protein